ncbi:MAG: hypothetical protein Q9203_004750 [Teloschistes exilis]
MSSTGHGSQNGPVFKESQSSIYQSLGYDFNFMNWRQLLKIAEDGFEQYKYLKHKHCLLTQQMSNLEEAALHADIAQQSAIDLIRHHFTDLATRCFDYMQALAYMLHVVSVQSRITQLDARLRHMPYWEPDVKKWIWTISFLNDKQPVRFEHDS